MAVMAGGGSVAGTGLVAMSCLAWRLDSSHSLCAGLAIKVVVWQFCFYGWRGMAGSSGMAGGGADSYMCQCIEFLLSPNLEESAQPIRSVPLHSLSAVTWMAYLITAKLLQL